MTQNCSPNTAQPQRQECPSTSTHVGNDVKVRTRHHPPTTSLRRSTECLYCHRPRCTTTRHNRGPPSSARPAAPYQMLSPRRLDATLLPSLCVDARRQTATTRFVKTTRVPLPSHSTAHGTHVGPHFTPHQCVRGPARHNVAKLSSHMYVTSPSYADQPTTSRNGCAYPSA